MDTVMLNSGDQLSNIKISLSIYQLGVIRIDHHKSLYQELYI